MNILMQLQRELPLRIVLDILNDQGGHRSRFIPFGLQVEFTGWIDKSSIFLCPFKISLIINDYFQLIGKGYYFGKRRFEFFWGEADPVPLATERVGARCFNIGLKTGTVKCLCKRIETMH